MMVRTSRLHKQSMTSSAGLIISIIGHSQFQQSRTVRSRDRNSCRLFPLKKTRPQYCSAIAKIAVTAKQNTTTAAYTQASIIARETEPQARGAIPYRHYLALKCHFSGWLWHLSCSPGRRPDLYTRSAAAAENRSEPPHPPPLEKGSPRY